MSLIPLILAGGAGTRLWPVSREAAPKPFIPLPDGQTLLQKTMLRAAALSGTAEVITITNREYYFRTKDEYSAIKLSTDLKLSYILEPFGRNTASAVAIGAITALEHFGSNATLLVLPADHLIQDLSGFQNAVAEATHLAKQGFLVTFGIKPLRPETGYGYIETGQSLDTQSSYRAKRFVEKPSEEVAASYLAAGHYWWNSGMFCFTVNALLQALEQHAPKILQQAQTTWSASKRTALGNSAMHEVDAASFAAMPSISLDYAVMEKADNVALVPSCFDWSDIGSWQALSELTPPDRDGNRVLGEAVTVGTSNTYIQTDGRLIAAVGVSDLMIIDTEDAVLIAHRDQAQEVKAVANELKARGHEAYKLHRTVTRPWGTYTVLQEGPRFKIKRIEVKPKQALSLQMHHHRSEHWIVVNGTAEVTRNQETYFVRTNESTYIPAGQQHRLANPGIVDLVLIEVQCGDYLGEDDIVRFDDRYGRVAAKTN